MEILITYGHREEDLASLPIRDLALFVLEREIGRASCRERV